MKNKLERKYGLFTAICMVVGIVIGSGVFFKAQTILQRTGGDTAAFAAKNCALMAQVSPITANKIKIPQRPNI